MENLADPPAQGEVLLRVEDVSRIYDDGQVQALKGVSLAVVRGQYLAIVGPSGSGKSTLLNLLGGLDQPSSGRVLFAEEPITDAPTLDRLRSTQIGYVFQSFYLLPTLSAAENVQLPMFESGLTVKQREARARQLLETVGMKHRMDHVPTKLSVGERQRVAIARALANDPVVILADEPTGNLDTKTGSEILDLFEKLHREGKTLVVITHSHEVAARAERTIEVRDGEIIRDDLRPVATTANA